MAWNKEARDKLDHSIALWDKMTCGAFGRKFDEKVWTKAALTQMLRYTLPSNLHLAVEWALEELENEETSSGDSE